MSKILANASAKDRPDTDFYQTPLEVTQALINFLKLDKGTYIWEPACGKGMMSNVLRNNGYIVTESDIETGTDFLLQNSTNCSWIITNPPFSLAEEFIRRSYTLNVNFAFLLKSQYWHAVKRNKLFFDIKPSFVLPLSWRPDFLFGAKSGAPTMEVLWTVWIKGQINTIYEPLIRPVI